MFLFFVIIELAVHYTNKLYRLCLNILHNQSHISVRYFAIAKLHKKIEMNADIQILFSLRQTTSNEKGGAIKTRLLYTKTGENTKKRIPSQWYCKAD